MNLFRKNYLTMIENSAQGENHMFRNYVIDLNGQEVDVLKGGALSCAAYVSAILYLQNPPLKAKGSEPWLDSTHANVTSTEKDMGAHGWYLIDEVRYGAVITWEQKPGADGTLHWHQGFSMDHETAISNGSNSSLMPQEHHYTYDGTRKIERIWWHDALNEEE